MPKHCIFFNIHLYLVSLKKELILKHKYNSNVIFQQVTCSQLDNFSAPSPWLLMLRSTTHFIPQLS